MSAIPSSLPAPAAIPSGPTPTADRVVPGRFEGDPALSATQAAAVDDRAQQAAFTQWLDDGRGGRPAVG